MGEFRNSTIDLADLSHSFVIRNNEKLDVDFEALILKGNTKFNILLKDGDYINIPSSLTQHVHILGRISFPRKVNYLNKLTILQAITEGRGLLPDASKKVLVLRGSLSKPQKIIIDLEEIINGEKPDVLLKPKDIVYIPEDGNAEIEALGKTAIRAFVRTIASRAADNSTDFLIKEKRIENDVNE